MGVYDKVAKFLETATQKDDPAKVANAPKYALLKEGELTDNDGNLVAPNGLDTIADWSARRFTKTTMFTKLGIDKKTFYKWRKEFPEFNYAIQEGEVATEESLLETAHKLAHGGFKVYEQVVDKDGDVHTIYKETKPDGSMLKHLLQVENPKDHVIKEKTEISVDNEGMIMSLLHDLDANELQSIIDKAAEK